MMSPPNPLLTFEPYCREHADNKLHIALQISQMATNSWVKLNTELGYFEKATLSRFFLFFPHVLADCAHCAGTDAVVSLWLPTEGLTAQL